MSSRRDAGPLFDWGVFDIIDSLCLFSLSFSQHDLVRCTGFRQRCHRQLAVHRKVCLCTPHDSSHLPLYPALLPPFRRTSTRSSASHMFSLSVQNTSLSPNPTGLLSRCKITSTKTSLFTSHRLAPSYRQLSKAAAESLYTA